MEQNNKNIPPTCALIIAFAHLVVPKSTIFVWAYMMITPFSLKELLTDVMLHFLSGWTSLGRESPFRHKVVYIVDDGRSLRRKSIHHKRENTMLFSSIHVVHCKWPTISPFNSLTANLLNWLLNSFRRACEWKLMCFVLAFFVSSSPWSNAWILSYERTETFIRCCCM